MIAATGTDLATSLLVFAGGGGGVALITGLLGRGRSKAETSDITAAAAAKVVGVLGEVIERLEAEQTRLAARVAEQGSHIAEQDRRIAFLEHALQRTTGERDWWRRRALTLEEVLRSNSIAVPEPPPEEP